ncbi:DEAD/DEAH box helicase [Anaeromyxobacter oryzae]|uniref:DEAD/DEAH box helicase n=1 Tax=Anaeromyxobacter oryzae TaxID=2918170 RepID=A0ABM7X0S3_9BACT|nr:DEAD/DEAH box helicase [Anaeromyxobacter oryzae]BDG05300.1 DEAD/DEAH box helicase [Anaeromyxobacter oryzae]
MTHPPAPPAPAPFPDLGAHPALARALERKGYAEPTPVQAAVLSPDLRGKDLLVSSRTGSGKTVAFGLVLADALLGEAAAFGEAGPPAALVVAPTRELALQVQRELSWLLAETGARVVACVGGMDARREARALGQGAHLVVGTPGRLLDHHRRGALDLSALAALVLDEADEMLDMGFRDELEALLAAAAPDRRTIMFSATLPKPIVELAHRYTRDAVRVAATPAREAHADIAYRAHLVAPAERELAIVNVLRAVDPPSALVFRATREAAHHTAAALDERGFSAVAISGELTQAERLKALKALRDGRARLLVATDVAARGLDLPNIGLVLHGDLPRDPEALQHRSGRTGRAGKKGIAVLLAEPRERFKLERMLREANVRVEWAAVPAADAIRAQDEERLAAEVEALATDATDDERAAATRLLEGRDPLLVAAALVREKRARLPAPEELPETAVAATERPAPPRERKARGGPPTDVVWFKITIGRERNADPKWILPLLCRRGGVTRDAIGKIVVDDRETRFQIARASADAFAQAARRPDPRAPGVRIEVVRGGGEAPAFRGGPAGRASTGPGRTDAHPARATSHAPAQRSGTGHAERSGDGHSERRGAGHSDRKVRIPKRAETTHERKASASATRRDWKKPRP